MEPLRRIALAAAVGLVAVLPVAAAHDGCPDHPNMVDLFLKKDTQGRLALSYLAPSAASATTWTAELSPGGAKTVAFDFPIPAFAVDERVELTGQIRLESEAHRTGSYISDSPFFRAYPHAAVDLLEGERSVRLVDAHYVGGEYKFSANYPGHGRDGAPHTHGDGTDASRGLYTSDLRVRMSFDLQASDGPGGFGDANYTVSVHVDGKTFLRLAKAGEAPQPSPTPTATTPAPPSPSSLQANNTTAPSNGTNGAPSSGQPPSTPPRILSAMVDRVGAPVGVAASMVVASTGLGLLLWRRRST